MSESESKMSDVIIEAKQREKSGGKYREIGYIPGVLYGDGIDSSMSVKFDALALNKVIAKQGVNAKIWVKLDKQKSYGFIKEIQREVMSRRVNHVDVQIVSKDHEIQMLMPITFIGENDLNVRQLMIQVYKPEVSVYGKMDQLPSSVSVVVSDMKLGDTVTRADLGIDTAIINDLEDTVYGAVTYTKRMAMDATAEEVPTI